MPAAARTRRKQRTKHRSKHQRQSKRRGQGTKRSQERRRQSQSRNLTVRQGRIRYRRRPGVTPKTFSTILAKRILSSGTSAAERLPGTPADSKAACARMRVPRQHVANCWLNAAVMSLFVSTGMHASTRLLQEAMIDPPRRIPHQLRSELRQLALIIRSVPLGILPPRYSTEQLIPALNAADKAGLTTPSNRLGAPKGQAHNPVWFFTALSTLLHPHKFEIGRVDLTRTDGKPHTDLAAALRDGKRRNGDGATRGPPRVLLIEAGQESAGTRPRLELAAAVSRTGSSVRAFGRKWKLDSVIMLDTGDSHFGGVVTCGGVPQTYDGMTGALLHPKESWRQVMTQLVNRPIPTPSRQEFRYDVQTGYAVFAFVPSAGAQR